MFGDLLTGHAQNWHSQMSRTIRRTWKDILEGFLVQYGGYGVSNARQYTHARKRPDETPLGYMDRLERGRYPSQGRYSREKTLRGVSMWNTLFLRWMIAI